MQNKDNALNFLAIDSTFQFHPNSVRCYALSDLEVGTLIPGTRLSYYLEHDPALYYYNRNTAVVKVYTSPHERSAAVTRMYAWSNYLLLRDKTNDVVRPSCLFACPLHRQSETDPYSKPNIIFHFLASGDVIGEVIQRIPKDDFLRRDQNQRHQSWIRRNIVHYWYHQKTWYQAHFLCAWDIDLDKYFSLCLDHDEYVEQHEDESLDLRKWFNRETLEKCCQNME